MDIDDVPWVTLVLGAGMALVYVVNPAITPLTYTLLAPWMHAGFGHIWQNLLVFSLLGVGVERRVGWLSFGTFAVLIGYLALYLPVVLGYGGLSRGASGLTMALTGYAVPVLFVILTSRIDAFEQKWREVVVGILILFSLFYLTFDSGVTVKRFFYLAERPEGVSVSSHFTGLVLGAMWFVWRMVRHGLQDA